VHSEAGMAVVHRGTTPLPVTPTPAGLVIVRSPAWSPFRLASMPLCAVIHSPV
jgi:hypothetical protein